MTHKQTSQTDTSPHAPTVWTRSFPRWRLLAIAMLVALVGGAVMIGPRQTRIIGAQTAPSPDISFFGCRGGEPEYYTVPAGTSWLGIRAWGGSGMSVRGAQGGVGASAAARLQVTPGQRLAVQVGCAGGSPWNNGGGFASGGGGGRSDLADIGGGGGGSTGVQLCPTGACWGAGSRENILVVAGGGGGGGGRSEVVFVTGNGGDGGSGGATGRDGQRGGGTNHVSGGGGGDSSNRDGTGSDGWGSIGGGGGGGGGAGYPRGGDGGRGGSCQGCGGGGGGGGGSYVKTEATGVSIVDGGARRGHGLVIITPVRPTQPVPTIGVFQCNNGNVETYTVPAGVTSIHAVLVGAVGGRGDSGLGGAGGSGARVTGTLQTSPGDRFGAVAGCSNGGNSGRGYGSGGRGGANDLMQTRAGGGGGASAVLRNPNIDARPLLVAGGGGGAGDGQYSGSGGYNITTGLNGQSGLSNPVGGSGGGGGTAGGAGGRNGTNGRGLDCPIGGGGGGGGGGGYPNGGSGGGAGSCPSGGGGGGAGMSFKDDIVQNAVITPGGGGSTGGLVLLIAAPPGPPMAPTAVLASGTDSGATVGWATPADDGGLPITSYTVTASPGGARVTSRFGPVVFVGLTNGTVYTFSVVATNAAGSSEPAVSNPVTPRPFPGQPAITSVTAGDRQASVAFTPPTVGAPFTSYTVTARTGGQVSGPGLTATGPASPVTIAGLTNGSTYVITAYATNSSGNGPESPIKTVTPLGLPGAPTNVTATSGNGLATVSFTPPANTGGAPNLSYSVASSPGGITVTAGGSPVQVNGLINGTTYTFTVRASNAAGNGPASAPSNPVTPNAFTIPSPPLFPQAFAGDQRATVAFSPSLSDGGSPITAYTVTSSPGGATATGAASPITVDGLANGTSYTFTVVATNAAGNSQPSTVSNAVTPMPATTPNPPQAPVASAGNQGARVSFTPPAGDGGSPITAYTVTASPGGITATGTDSPVTITGLTNGVSYTFTVVATNTVGDSQPSTASNAVTPSAALAPANDNFAAARVIGGSGTVTGTTENATREAGEPTHANRGGGTSVWYVWTAPQGGVLQIDTCGSSITPVAAVYSGSSMVALTPLGASTVAVFCGASGWQSGIQVTVPADAGTVYIAVDGANTPGGSATGSFSLHWGQGG